MYICYVDFKTKTATVPLIIKLQIITSQYLTLKLISIKFLCLWQNLKEIDLYIFYIRSNNALCLFY